MKDFKDIGSIDTLEEGEVEVTTPKRINQNVVLTNFEKEMLGKLCTTDDEGNVTHDVTIKDIYGMNLFSKIVTNEDTGTERIVKNKFLSFAGRFKNKVGTLLNVTMVITDDKQFYMTLGNQAIKAETGKDLFVSHLPHMQMVLATMQGGFLSEEDITKEAEGIDNFGI